MEPNQEPDLRQAKAAYCQECGGWITVACFPRCEADSDSRREFAKHAKAGDPIKVITMEEVRDPSHKMCVGHKKKKVQAADLFSPAKP